MAIHYGNQYQAAFVDVPPVKIIPGDVSGEVKVMYFDFTVPAVAPVDGDVFKLGKLPKGCKIVNAILSFPDLGTAGVVELGWAASADAVEAADDNGFLASVDVNAAANTVQMLEQVNMPGFGKLFESEVDLELKVTTAWTATSGVVKGMILYRTI